MANRIIPMEKNGDNYIVYLNPRTTKLLWEIMEHPDNDLIQFITRYGNLVAQDQSSLPSLVEVIKVDMTDEAARMNFIFAIKALSTDKEMGVEIYRGLARGSIPISTIKVKFEMEVVLGGTDSLNNATTVALTTERDPLDISSDEDEFKSIDNQAKVSKEPKLMIGFQPSMRFHEPGPINRGLKEKMKTVIVETYVPKAFPEQAYAKDINHSHIPDLDPYSRASKLEKLEISKKRLENLSSHSSVLAFIRELEAYIKSGVTKGIVVSTIADAKTKTMEFLAQRFNLTESETQNLTFDELRLLYAMKITRNMNEVAPTVAREDVLKSLKDAGSGRYASWNLSHMKTNNMDKAASFIAEIDLVMTDLFGEGEIDYYTMKLFTDGVKVHDKDGHEKWVRIIGSDDQFDNIRANIKKYATTWAEIKNILKVTAEEMDVDVLTRMNKGLLKEQKEQISKMLKAEERQAQEREKKAKDAAKNGDKKSVNQNQSGKPDGKKPLVCDICQGSHYAFDKDLKVITCEKHKDTDLTLKEHEKLKKDIEDKLAKRKKARAGRPSGG